MLVSVVASSALCIYRPAVDPSSLLPALASWCGQPQPYLDLVRRKENLGEGRREGRKGLKPALIPMLLGGWMERPGELGVEWAWRGGRTGGLKQEGGGMGKLGHSLSWKEVGHQSESGSPYL